MVAKGKVRRHKDRKEAQKRCFILESAQWLQETLKRSEDKTSACNGCSMNLRGGQGNKSGKGGRAAAARSGFPPFTPGCAGLWWTRTSAIQTPTTVKTLALPEVGDVISTAATAPLPTDRAHPLRHQHTARLLCSSRQVLYLSSLPFPSNPNPVHSNFPLFPSGRLPKSG